MIGITRQPIADDFGIDTGAARLRVFESLQNDNSRTLAHDETIAILVVGA